MAEVDLDFVIRPASSVEEASMLWWPLMKELGWNRSENDAQSHFSAAQNGKNWLMIAPNTSSKPEGCVIAITYPNHTGWVAFFMLNARYRQQGLGRALWKEMEMTFAANRTKTIGLDGVQEQVETYKRRGYVDCALIPLMLRTTFQDQPWTVTWDDSHAVDMQNILDVDRKALAKLDLELTGLERSPYWATDALLSRTDAFGYAITSGRNVTGFVFVRKCEKGHRLGLLYAASYVEARHLLHKAMQNTIHLGGTLIAEIFGTNPDGRRLFEELGWHHSGTDYHRMWLHGQVPEEQQKGGRGAKSMFATFDACAG